MNEFHDEISWPPVRRPLLLVRSSPRAQRKGLLL
jgi:hypothetical protein